MTVDGFEEVKEVSVVKGKGLYSVVTNEVTVLTLCNRTIEHLMTSRQIIVTLFLLHIFSNMPS